MKTKKKIKIKKKEFIIIATIITIVILFFSGFSMWKAYSRTDINGDTEIANPIIKVEYGNPINITNKNQEGIYEFKVKNYEETINLEKNITQVGLNYYIEILNPIDKSIKIELYKNEEKIEFNGNKTETFYMPKNVEKIDNYKMIITYNKKDNIDIIQELQIKVHSEQEKIE